MYESEDKMVSHPDHYTSSNMPAVGRRKTESRIWKKSFGTHSI